MRTFGDLKDQVGQVLEKLKDQKRTKSHNLVECNIEGTNEMFEAGITWNDIMDIPDDAMMNRIISQGPVHQGQAFMPIKATAIEGHVVLTVKPIDT